jgi:hypothetical protein
MTTLNMKRVEGSKPAEFPGKGEVVAEGSQIQSQTQDYACGNVPGLVQGPMSQQTVLGSHGYDIHPQKFVRLVGWREK